MSLLLMHHVFRARSLMLFGVLCAALVAWRVGGTPGGEAPSGYAAGVYAWEQAPGRDDGSGLRRFRWTRGRALLHDEIRGQVLRMPLYLARPYRPDMQVAVQISVNGVPADRVILTRNGWHEVTCDLRALLGEARWAALAARHHAPSSERRKAQAIWVELRVDPTFVPAEAGASTDTRTLGVGVGELAWSGDRP